MKKISFAYTCLPVITDTHPIIGSFVAMTEKLPMLFKIYMYYFR